MKVTKVVAMRGECSLEDAMTCLRRWSWSEVGVGLTIYVRGDGQLAGASPPRSIMVDDGRCFGTRRQLKGLRDTRWRGVGRLWFDQDQVGAGVAMDVRTACVQWLVRSVDGELRRSERRHRLETSRQCGSRTLAHRIQCTDEDDGDEDVASKVNDEIRRSSQTSPV